MNPILCCHGALGSARQFEGLQALIAPRRPCHVVNFSGHGSDAHEGKLSFNLFVQNILDYIDQRKLEEVDLFGYSMGGYAALLFAYQYPERVRSVKTLGTKFQWDSEFAAAEVLKLNPQKIAEKVPAYADYMQSLHGIRWKQLVRQTADMMLYLGEFPALDDGKLQAIQHPVVIGLGSLDKMVGSEESRHVAEQLPNGKFQLLADVVHPFERIPTSLVASYLIDH